MKKSMTEQLDEILTESLKTIDDNSDKWFREAAEESVAMLRAKSPKRPGGGRYAAGWTFEPKTGGLKGYIVHNATDYQLTHLLENGHALWNGTKRVKAQKHIAPVEKAEIAKILAKMSHVTE